MVLQPKPVINNKRSRNNEPSPSSAEMDAMRKMLRSPLAQKKPMVGSSPCPGRVFGQPLDEVESDNGVPAIVQAVCLFILNNGVHYEGIFRVNGNSRVVDRLRETFDKSVCAVCLEPGDDVFAVASLLKMYVREIPDYLIPEKATKQFVHVQEVHGRDEDVLLPKLRSLLLDLPPENYCLLKYLCRFMVLVSLHEKHNKMGPTALGIVFAPNLFRCSDNLAGLREQGITNQICAKFLVHYDKLFGCPPDLSPYTLRVLDVETMDTPSPRIIQVDEKRTPRTPPPRPPPPKLDDTVPERSVRSERRVPARPPPPKQDDTQPVPSPRRNRPRGHFNQRHLSAHDLDDYSDDSLKENATPGSRLASSLDEDLTNSRVSSPFLLADSSDVESLGPSPRVSVSTSDFVELTIHAAVREHLFGEDGVRSSDEYARAIHDSPQTTPRNRARDNTYSRSNGKTTSLTVPDVYKKISPTNSTNQHSAPVDSISIRVPTAVTDNKEEQSSPRSTSPTPVPSPRRKLRRSSLGTTAPRTQPTQISEPEPHNFDSIEPDQNKLNLVKRTRGPADRRLPTRKRHSGEAIDDVIHNDVTPVTPYGNDYETSDDSGSAHNHFYRNLDTAGQLAADHNNIRFLDKVDLDTEGANSAASSPGSHRKQPFIPRLDLTTLHQHGDGTDPISIKAGLSLALRTVEDEPPAQVSPRVKINNYTSEPDVVTSQQTYTDTVWNADDDSMTMKSVTKRIQGLKRRLRSFEESFEDENGYRPSASDKAAVPHIKQLMSDLAKARKELKKLKARTASAGKDGATESQDERRYSDPGYVRSSSDDVETESPDIYRTFSVITRRLREKRCEAGRAEELSVMSKAEVRDEKLAVQKGLLYFESLHGRPSTKEEKELMRPLYDRYRNVKRLMASLSVNDRADDLLPVVHEDQQLDVTPLTTAKTNRTLDPIRIPVADSDDQQLDDEFMVTKKPISPDPASSPIAPPRLRKPRLLKEQNLHEMTLSDLLEEQNVVRVEKRRLRKILKDFEDKFYDETGQKVQKEDRTPMEADYMAYKQTKAKLRLIDALISKNDPAVSL